ncbi:BolA domain UV induced protein Uvi31 [Malassezia sp. CBS 17886]|nr:BolA domain UV induced protein Uvi31 [Malassezia sp. CBS 17886]
MFLRSSAARSAVSVFRRTYVASVMSIEESIREKVTGALAPTHLFVRNEYVGRRAPSYASSARHAHHAAMVAQGGGNGQTHFFLEVVSDQFQGKPQIARHRTVNAIVAPEFERGLHALTLRLRTPAEFATEQAGAGAA